MDAHYAPGKNLVSKSGEEGQVELPDLHGCMLEDPASWLARHGAELGIIPHEDEFGSHISMDSGYRTIEDGDDALEEWRKGLPTFNGCDGCGDGRCLYGVGTGPFQLPPHFTAEVSPTAPITWGEANQTEIGILQAAGRNPSNQIKSLQMHEHSNDELSSHQTETSTPESGSFWLAEYLEDENEKLGGDHPFMRFKSLAVMEVFRWFNAWTERPMDQNTPCNGAGESNSSETENKGKTAVAKGKRTWADRQEPGEDITDSSGPSSNQTASSKRRRTSDRKVTFACPYTKKDPMSYRDCYKYTLSRIRDVKQHLARCHRNAPYCPVCMGTFQTEEERDGHVREFSCPSRPSIRLDGITESQRSQLAKKSASNTSPEAQWFVVFDIVFPGHKPRPQSPYIDSELLQDITLYQHFLTNHGPRILSGILDQRGIVTWNLPNEERDLAAFQQTVFEEGLVIIFEQWLAQRNNSGHDSNGSSRSANTGQDTPPSSSNSREGIGSTSVHDSGAVPPESLDVLPVRAPVDALPEGESFPASSADQFSYGEELDRTFGFEYGGVEFPVGSACNVDEMVRLFMDDAQAGSDFPPDLG